MKGKIHMVNKFNNNTKPIAAKTITTNALAIAMVCVLTMFPQIPIPLGYMHLGNACILLAGSLLGPVTGLLAGGIGSALADLITGYPQWIVPTLIIKCIMGFSAGAISHSKAGRAKTASIRTLLASVTAVIIMIGGYFIGGSILYGSIITGAAQIPGLAFEGIVGIILFYVIGLALEAAKIPLLISGSKTSK